eukprot:m.247594 g.247594  ORF g.247594 m.247594 type:complete len:244 (+) comp17486_c0_seq11:186-917(+)
MLACACQVDSKRRKVSPTCYRVMLPPLLAVIVYSRLGNEETLPISELLPVGSIDTSSYDTPDMAEQTTTPSQDGDDGNDGDGFEWPDVAMVPTVNVQAIQQASSESAGLGRGTKVPQDAPHHWKEGDVCLCTYEADSLVYPATITSLDAGKQTCSVTFHVYGNRQDNVDLLSLTPAAESQAAKSFPIARQGTLPIPTHPVEAPQDQQALSSMLMAWYYSGFYTGYYQAQQNCSSDPAHGNSLS